MRRFKGNDVEYVGERKLDSKERAFIRVPESLILDCGDDDKRISVYSFFASMRGIYGDMTFTLNELSKWMGRKPSRKKGYGNDALASTVSYLEGLGYINVDGDPKNTEQTDASFNIDFLNDKCSEERFGILYVDEIIKVLSYTKEDKKGRPPNKDAMLLILAYLRLSIPRRRNELHYDEIGIGDDEASDSDITKRRDKYPESCNAYFKDIAIDVGLTEYVASKYIHLLKDLKIIYFEHMPRLRFDGEWRTDCTLFCNWYKRDGDMLLASGSAYYGLEISAKKRLIVQSRVKKANKTKASAVS